MFFLNKTLTKNAKQTFFWFIKIADNGGNLRPITYIIIINQYDSQSLS